MNLSNSQQSYRSREADSPLVEVDGSIGGLGLEVGGNGSQTEAVAQLSVDLSNAGIFREARTVQDGLRQEPCR